MDFIRDWIGGVAATAVLTALALAATPQGTVRKVVTLCAGLVMTAALIRPLVGLDGHVDVGELIGAYQTEGLQDKANETLSGIIAGQTAAYILNKAEPLGIRCTVEVKCRMGEYYPEPWSVTIRSRTPEHAMSALSDMIAKDTGIPPERQKYALSADK